MWLKPGARPKRFTAVQEYVVLHVAFRWRARFAIAGVFPLRVVDRYSRRGGSLEARLFGAIPLTRDSGPSVAAGQALRYLAELPWVPHAFLANQEIELRELDDRAVEAATQVGRRPGGRAARAMRRRRDRRASAMQARGSRTEGARLPGAGTFEAYKPMGGSEHPDESGGPLGPAGRPVHLLERRNHRPGSNPVTRDPRTRHPKQPFATNRRRRLSGHSASL